MPIPNLSTASIGDWALYYHVLGWSVVPAWRPVDGGCECQRGLGCESPGKHPRVAWVPYQTKRPSVQQVRAWWRAWPEANISVVTGAVSGVVVLDVDPRHDGDESVLDLGRLPDTPTVLTGGGGVHYWFAHPGGRVGNGADLLPGLDFRGDGGQVIVPPSFHASGQRYEWEAGYEAGGLPLAPLPASVQRLLRGEAPLPAVAVERRLDPEDYLSRGVRIPLGARNQTLTRLAGLYIARGHSEVDTLGLIHGLSQLACDEPLAIDELRTIVHSIAAAEQRKRAADEALDDHDAPETDIERRELLAATWRQLGLPVEGTDIVKVSRLDGFSFRLELADHHVDLGPSLLRQQPVRELVLNATNHLLKRMKPSEWDAHARRLTLYARDERVGFLRLQDQVADWLDGLREEADGGDGPVPLNRRFDALMTRPIYYQGRLAVRAKYLLTWLEQEYALVLTLPGLSTALKAGGWEPGRIRVSERPGRPPARVWLSPPVRDWAASEEDVV